MLRPSGNLLFAGLASRRGTYERLATAPRGCPPTLDQLDDIPANIIASLQLDEACKRELIHRHAAWPVPQFRDGRLRHRGDSDAARVWVWRNRVRRGDPV